MANKIGGQCFVKVGGNQYSTTGEFTVRVQNTKATPLVDTSGVIHYTEENVVSMISGSILTTDELNPQTVVDQRGVTVTVELANGKVAVLYDAVFTADADVNVREGSMAVEWQGRGRWI